MTLFQTWQEALLASWGQVWSSFLGFLPTFIGAVIVFVVGIFVASWVKRIVEEILKAVRLQGLSKSSRF